MKRKVVISITGKTEADWKEKLAEITQLGIQEAALFLEFYNSQEKHHIYQALEHSPIKSIPLVHLRHDMQKAELAFLQERFKTRYFTCHEINFARHDVEQWKGFYRNIYLEMDFDNKVPPEAKVESIGGFCIDLAHFKVAWEKLSKDFDYVWQRKEMHHYFQCNHISGWNKEKNLDKHTIQSLRDFDYISTLPHFILGECLAIETFNSITEQLAFKPYTEELLGKISHAA